MSDDPKPLAAAARTDFQSASFPDKLEFQLAVTIRDTAALLKGVYVESLPQAHFILGYDRTAAKKYFLSRCLMEVQYSAAALLRLATHLRAEAAREISTTDSWDEVLTRSIVVEQSGWRRRLVEILGALINFYSTNDDVHYFAYLLLQDLEKARRERLDAKNDWGVDSQVLARREAWLVEQLKAVLPASSLPWFARGDKASTVKAASAAAIQRSALRMGRPEERQALAYTYAQGFSDPSTLLHFSTTPSVKQLSHEMVELGAALIFMLATAIVVRTSELLGFDSTTSPVANTARSLAKAHGGQEAMPEPGDFVVIPLDKENPFLAQVVECRETSQGTWGARVKFIENTPYEGVTEDEVPSTFVLPLMRLKDLIAALVTKHPTIAQIPEIERAEACREALVYIWHAVLRDLYKRELRPS